MPALDLQPVLDIQPLDLQPVESESSPVPRDPSKPLLSELYPAMHDVASEWNITLTAPGESGLAESDVAKLNATKLDMVRKEAERRIAAGSLGKVGRGIQAAMVDLGTAGRDPFTLALVGGTAAVPALAPMAPLTARALASITTGTMAGATSKAIGEGMGSLSVPSAKLDDAIRTMLGMTVMTVGTAATARGFRAVNAAEAARNAVPNIGTPTRLGAFPPVKQPVGPAPVVPMENAAVIAGAAERAVVEPTTPVRLQPESLAPEAKGGIPAAPEMLDILPKPTAEELAINELTRSAGEEMKRLIEAEGKSIERTGEALPKPAKQGVIPTGALPDVETAAREPAGIRMIVEKAVEEAKGGLPTAEPTLDLLPAAEVEVLAINELLRQGIERGAATQFVESLGGTLRRQKDYPRAVAEKIAQQIAEGVKAMIHPDKPMTANQVKITYDSIVKAITENRLSEERPGVISGSKLEKWADEQIAEGLKRLNVGLDPVQLAAYAVKGAAILERGITDLAKWTAEMVKEYGPQIRPYLKNVRRESERVRQATFAAASKVTVPTAVASAPAPTTASALPRQTDLPTRLLPDMMPPAEAKQAFTQKFGAGNIPGIGKWFDPNAKPMTPAHASLQTYAAERYGVGPAYASRLGSLIKGLQDPFEVDAKTGDITNIGAREGQSRKISDVFEALQRDPNAYELNADQRAALERMAEIEMQFKELEERYQVNRSVDDEGIPFDDQAPGELAPAKPYFTRVVTARPKPKPATLKGQSVGAKQYFERPRMFDTEAEGWQRGYKYEPSIEKRIVTRAERLYKKIADKRLIEDSKSMSRTRSELDAQLRLEYADELASGEMTSQKLTQIGDSIEASGRVYQPGFQGRIFNYETAQALNKALERHTSVVRQALVKVNNAGKTLFLGFDFGNLFIQLLPTLYSNPAKWAQAATKSIQAFANERTFASYVRDNAGAVRELAEHGSSTGRLPEFLAGFGEGEIVSKIPGAKAFGRQFTSALDVAKIELWKAYREIIPPEQWMDAIRGIESQLLSGRMESIGVSPNRALTERAFFLAPAYYRGALDLVGNLASRNPSGQIARRAIGAYMTVGPALYLGMGAALVARGDMTEKELVERMNPGHRDFMMWRVRMGDKSVEVGFGGIYKSIVKLAANMVRTSVEHPENWLSLDPQENPITRWLRAHAAPGPAVVMDQITGRDFLGRDVDTTDIGPRVLPLALQAALRAVFPAEGDRPASPAEAVFSLLGLQAYTESVQREFESERNRMAESTHKKSYEDLSLQQQAQVVQKLQADERFKKPPGSSLQTERAIRAAKDRVTRIHDGLSGPSQELIEELELQVRGYVPVIRVGRVDVPLTEAQREQYEAEITKQYDQILSRITPRLRTLGANQRQDYLDARLEEARELARRSMIRQPQPTP